MVNKIWNIILTALLLVCIGWILKNEISYDRFSRYNYTVSLDYSSSNNTIVQVLSCDLTTKNNVISIDTEQGGNSVDNQFLPEAIKIIWFNYKENCFYQYSGPFKYNGLSGDVIRINFDQKNKLIAKFDSGATIELIGHKIEHSWFDKDYPRDQSVFFTNDVRDMDVTMNLASKSTFKDAFFANRAKYANSGYSRDYKTDSIVGNKLFFDKEFINTPAFTSISLKKPEFISGRPNFEHNYTLKIYVDFDTTQLFNILKDNPQKRWNLKYNFDQNDSLQNVQLSDPKQTFDLKYKVKYDTR